MDHDLSRITRDLARIEGKQDSIMAAQDDITAAVTALNSFLSDLSAQVQAIAAALSSGGGAPVDTSGLNAAVQQLPAAQAAIDALTGTGTSPAPFSPAPVAQPRTQAFGR
jgi:hypothetical protein